MPCSNRKDLTHCKARGRLDIGGTRFFYRTYLWDDRDALNACRVDYEGNPILGPDCDACVCHLRDKKTDKYFPMLGEIHFMSGAWDLNSIAHESLHASIDFALAVRLSPHEIFSGGGLSSNINKDLSSSFPGIESGLMKDEELFCYAHGEIVEVVHEWLSEVDK